jgi:flavin-dependent dehydrogenase
VDGLELDVADYARGRVFQPIHGFRVGLLGGAATTTPHAERPASWGIRRCEFDHYLLQRSGARLRLGEPLDELAGAAGDWVVNGELRARLVVGAGGHFCPVARAFDDPEAEPQPVVLAQEIEFEMSADQRRACAVDPAVPELFFCDDLAGYAWAFRKGDVLNVGLGREDPRELPAHVARFREFLVGAGKLPRDAPARFHGHAYRLYPRGRRQVVRSGMLLVGDSAGLAYAESGEGIRPAVESSLLAADTIANCAGDYSAERLAPYARRLVERFGPRSTGGLAGLAPAALRRGLGRALLGWPWFARRVVVDRWFLRAHVAALAVRRGPAD